MELTRSSARHFIPAKVHQDNAAPINSVDFHRTDNLLVTAGDDDTIHMYNTQTGLSLKTVQSKKYGVRCIIFSHHPSSVIYTSNKGSDHTIRYLSLHDNRFLRYFGGHTHRVTSLCISPRTDLFMSSSLDKTVRLWDLRSHVCQGILAVPSVPMAAFDQQGLIFGVGASTGVVKLFDARNFDKGPFSTFEVEQEGRTLSSFSCLKFSRDGKLILGVVEGRISVLDSFTGKSVLRQPIRHSSGAVSLEASFSPDGQFIVSGHEDHSVRVYDAATGEQVCSWLSHSKLPRSVKWSPNQMLVASACESLVLWIPDLQKALSAKSELGANG